MSKIEWTGKTWNPIVGCTKISQGCHNCYAEKSAGRNANFGLKQYQDVVKIDQFGETYLGQWNGSLQLVGGQLEKPLKRKKATTYFVCSMGDLFHEGVKFWWIDHVFAIIAKCPQHTFQLLTKRPERMAEYLEQYGDPLPNVWVGTTVENRVTADIRIPHLLKCQASVRFLSVEPMLGSIIGVDLKGINWVICGCESGVGAKRFELSWARLLHDQCQSEGIPFFMKQMIVDGKLSKDMDAFPEDMRIRELPC